MAQENASLDSLTGLHTRQTFEADFQQALSQAVEAGRPLSVAFFDIDHFWGINEQFGHIGGDAVLRCVAAIIRENLTDEFVARYGGDEFAIIFPGVEREQALLRMERIRATVETQGIFQDGKTKVEERLTISGGIAAYPIDGEEGNDLLRKADAALYRAKATGRNKIVLAYEERMVPKTAHFTQSQLERLSSLAKAEGVSDAVLLREALDDLLIKYQHGFKF